MWYMCEALGQSNQPIEIASEDNANENLWFLETGQNRKMQIVYH